GLLGHPRKRGVFVIVWPACGGGRTEEGCSRGGGGSLLGAAPPPRPADRPPLPAEIRIFRIVPGAGGGNRGAQRCDKRGSGDRASVNHGRLSLQSPDARDAARPVEPVGNLADLRGSRKIAPSIEGAYEIVAPRAA